MNSKQNFLFILPVLFVLLIPIVTADMAGPSTHFAGVPPALGLVMVYCINLIINSVIILLCVKGFQNYMLPKTRVNGLNIALLTVLGLLADVIGAFITYLLSAWVDLPYYVSPYFSAFVLFISVGVIVALSSYFLLFRKNLKKKQAWISAIIFGVISNPVWLFMLVAF